MGFSEVVSSPMSLHLFTLFLSVRWVPAFFPSMWRFVPRLSGFANHESGLNLGAGCLWWKLLNVSGTLCEAVVNYYYYMALACG